MILRSVLILLSIILLTKDVSTLCGPGCLSCKKIGFEDPKCVLCDSQNNYYMSDGECILSPLKNCSLLRFDGQCIYCEAGYFKELITETCEPVPASNAIEGCEFYEDLNTCVACKPGSYFDREEHKCKEVEPLIENCDYYESKTECLKCKKDYWVSYDKTGCFKGEASNCKVHSVLRCGKCVNDFFISNNNGLVNPGQSFAQIMWAGYMSFDKNPLIKFDQNACIRQVDENCTEFDTNFTCFKCNDGYFLFEFDRRCYPKPKTSVKNCLYYESDISCKKCEEGFHRELATKCTQNKVIEFCQVYNQESGETSCLECNEGYYADQTEHKCKVRDKSKQINFCKTYNKIGDNCSECIFGYEKTSDSLKCLKQIENCSEYQVSNFETESLNCYVCNEGYYLDLETKKCVQPAEFFTSKCKIYARTSDKCEECLDKTYIESVSQCASHDENVIAPFCSQMSKLTRNLCDTCEEGYFKFPAENSCIKLTKVIEACLQYENQDDCSICQQGYWGKKCEPIPENENCLEKKLSNGDCLLCKKNFYLDKTLKICKKPLPIEEEGCHDLELDNKVFTCNECKENMLSMKYENSYYCDKPDFDIPDNCVKMKYITQGNPLLPDLAVCISCQPGFYLKDGACIKQCNFDGFNVKIQELSISGNDLINMGQTKCDTISSETQNCALETYSITNKDKVLKKICAKCKIGMAEIIEVSVMKFAHTLTVNETLEFTNHPMTRLPALVCKTSSDVFSKVQSGSAKEGCKYFFGIDSFTCLRCKDGFSGITKKYSDSISAPETCLTAIPNCESTYNMKGANYRSQTTQILEGIFSCSHCSDDKIPFYHATSTEAGTYIPTAYNMTDTTPNATPASADGLLVTCRNPIVSSDWETETTLVKPYEGTCGLGVVMVDKAKTANDFLRCVACAPGFKATYDENQSDSIKTCSKIDNCDTTFGFQWFNACSKCTAGFLYMFDKNKKVIEYHTCITKSQGNLSEFTNNCFAAHPDDGCYVCEEGYTLNEDLKCEVISSYDCSTNFVNNLYPIGSFDIDATYYDFTLPLIYDFDGKGCQKCASPDHVAFLVETPAKYFCTPRTYIAFNNFISGSNFVDNCLRYKGGNDNFKCITCREKYVVVENYTQCVTKTADLSNCIVVKTSNNAHCKTCSSGYLVFENKCEPENIKFCTQHNVDATGVICDVCENGYVKSGDSKACVSGAVDNCLTYGGGGDGDCQVCKEGYGLFADKDNSLRCIFMYDSNCKKWKNDSLILNKYECEICENGFGPNIDKNKSDFRPNVCFGPVTVSNCIEYGYTNPPIQESYKCIKCSPSHYLDNGLCKIRAIIDVNCIEYIENEDKCNKCSEDTIISDDKTKCQGRPTGVANCDAYSNLTTCSLCNDNFFLANNQCSTVPEAIEGCIRYSTAFECKTCGDGFFMNLSKRCIATTAQNCKTFKDEKECLECKDGTFFKDKEITDGEGNKSTIKECVPEPVVENCDQQSSRVNVNGEKEYYCLVCAENYFITLEGCQPVTEPISDCLYYSAKSECLFCNPGKIATENRKACVNPENILNDGLVPDNECVQNRVSKAPICTVCDPGYLSNETTCVKCNTGANCMKCDPFIKSRCVICNSGFWMNEEYECIANSVSIEKASTNSKVIETSKGSFGDEFLGNNVSRNKIFYLLTFTILEVFMRQMRF